MTSAAARPSQVMREMDHLVKHRASLEALVRMLPVSHKRQRSEHEGSMRYVARGPA